MNITSDELYEAIKCLYQRQKDNPDEFQPMDECLENVEESAYDLLKMYQGHILAQRLHKKENN